MPQRKMNLSTVVVDDEQPSRNELCFQLELLKDVEVVGQARDGAHALRIIKELKPDLVMLDIQMPGPNGFDVARELVSNNIDSQVIFVTAYDQYAIKAFEVNAVDYLLKPIDPDRLAEAVLRARSHIRTVRISEAQVTALENSYSQQVETHRKRSQIAVKIGDRLLLVQPDDIVYASLSDDVITLVAGNLRGVSNCRTLDELHSVLDPNVFWRVHRSHIVNINKIKEIVPWFSRNYILKMKDPKNTEIPVSRTQTKRLREYLNL